MPKLKSLPHSHPFFDEALRLSRHAFVPPQCSECLQLGAQYAATDLFQQLSTDLASPFAFILLLGETGSGKTTSLQYFYHHLQKQKNEYQVHFISLAQPDALSYIRNIQEKKQTVLLLDALDAFPPLASSYEEVMHKVLPDITDFTKVIISCTTGFFPTEIEQAHKKGDLFFKQYSFRKRYLAPYPDAAIQKSAQQLAKSKVSMRKMLENSCQRIQKPALLRWLNYLVDHKKYHQNLHEAIGMMMRAWCQQQLKYAEDVDEFVSYLRCLALDMYRFRHLRGMWISRDDARFLAYKYRVQFDRIPLASDGMFRTIGSDKLGFLHELIPAYFIAEEAMKSKEFESNLDFQRFAFVRELYEELCWHAFLAQFFSQGSWEGAFRTKYHWQKRPLNQLSFEEMPFISRLYLSSSMGNEFRFLQRMRALQAIHLYIPLEENLRQAITTYFPNQLMLIEHYPPKTRRWQLKNGELIPFRWQAPIKQKYSSDFAASILHLLNWQQEKDEEFAWHNESERRMLQWLTQRELRVFDQVEKEETPEYTRLIWFHEYDLMFPENEVAEVLDDLLDVCGEDDQWQSVLQEDDLGQIEDGFWLGRCWNGGQVRFWMEERKRLKLSLYTQIRA